ncbi:metal ABC transporter solute-binding protein, Zn/Mn family [Bacillus sp. FJAT-44742]|uniref:metal ABC transporter solute-binding protein, Zn/Mn family n=1 Tax=Bacillus sp. FJAT-44742 TaxID=2014005 RepID=UPI000C230EC7|nr:zinc ABC transporter substrate-binding protein [Bacillus sp. FJAT-44742]
MKAKAGIACTIGLSAVLAACGEADQTEEATEQDEGNGEETETIDVYTTLFALEDFANRIGGEAVNVTNIVPVGADAHSFEPTAQTMIDIAESDMFLYNGAGMEGFADAVEDTLQGEDVKVVKAVEGIDLIDYGHDHDHEHGHDDDHGHDDHSHEEDEHGHDDHTHEEDEHGHDDHAHEEDEDHSHDDHGHSHDHGDEDPHVWLDPVLSIEMAENIKEALVEVNPEESETFENNFEELQQELETLHEEFEVMVEAADKDTFIVSHAGYGYWEQRYGLNQLGISGLSPTNEPSQKQLEEIIQYAEDHDIEYVMFEQNITPQVAEVVQDEVGAEALRLHNLEALVEEDEENEEDYFSLMRRNIENLETALQ